MTNDGTATFAKTYDTSLIISSAKERARNCGAKGEGEGEETIKGEGEEGRRRRKEKEKKKSEDRKLI